MDCKQFRGSLDCYADGELSAAASAAADAHRRECPSCAAIAERVLRLKGAVRQTVGGVAVPPGLVSRVASTTSGVDRPHLWPRRTRWALLAAAAVIAIATSIVAMRPAVGERAADGLDRLALRVDDDSAVILEGTVLCRDCELEHRFGVKASCQLIGHHGAIATVDGRIWNIVEQRSSASLIHDESLLGKRVVVHGRVLRGARAVVIDRYQIVS